MARIERDRRHLAPEARVTVREVEPDDVPQVVEMVHELAEYERAPQECHLTADQLEEALFSPAPALFGHVAVQGRTRIGCALWFLSFSTWRGVHGVHLEDLFVRPGFRDQGAGRMLLARLAAVCVERGYGRLEWAVLDWNEPAIGFYRKLGAVSVDDWTTFRLDGEPLRRLGAGDRSASSAQPS